jgi:UTP--glucose-1-phosphate uridylyltransferase
MATKKITKLVIPAAGFGTRFLPATKSVAKEMIPILNVPTIHYLVQEALDSGVEEIIIVVSSQKNAIIDYFDHSFELETVLKEKNKVELYKLVTGISNMARVS